MFVGNVAISTTPLPRLFQPISTITTQFFSTKVRQSVSPTSQPLPNLCFLGKIWWGILKHFNFMGYHLDLLPTQ